mgnify:CR=1 FL=1
MVIAEARKLNHLMTPFRFPSLLVTIANDSDCCAVVARGSKNNDDPVSRIVVSLYLAKVRLRGVEGDSVSAIGVNELGQSENQRAAESGAVGLNSCQNDSRLQELIDRWSALPEDVREAIWKLVEQI